MTGRRRRKKAGDDEALASATSISPACALASSRGSSCSCTGWSATSVQRARIEVGASLRTVLASPQSPPWAAPESNGAVDRGSADWALRVSKNREGTTPEGPRQLVEAESTRESARCTPSEQWVVAWCVRASSATILGGAATVEIACCSDRAETRSSLLGVCIDDNVWGAGAHPVAYDTMLLLSPDAPMAGVLPVCCQRKARRRSVIACSDRWPMPACTAEPSKVCAIVPL